MPEVDISSLPLSLQSYYTWLFKAFDQDNDGVIGSVDALFFKKSELPLSTLNVIWQLVDEKGEGFLQFGGFVLAMSLISVAQQGRAVTLSSVQPLSSITPPTLKDIHPYVDDISIIDLFTTTTITNLPPTTSTTIDNTNTSLLNISSNSNSTPLINITPLSPSGNLQTTTTTTSSSSTPSLSIAPSNNNNNTQSNTLIPPPLIDVSPLTNSTTLIPNLASGNLPTPTTTTSSTLSLPNSPMIESRTQNVTSKTSATNDNDEWVLSNADRTKFSDLFNKTDTGLTGYITGLQAKNLFTRSGLPNMELAKIWTLSDLDQDQRLNKSEFYTAMFLINQRLRGKELPSKTPESLIASSKVLNKGDFGGTEKMQIDTDFLNRNRTRTTEVSAILPSSTQVQALAEIALVQQVNQMGFELNDINQALSRLKEKNSGITIESVIDLLSSAEKRDDAIKPITKASPKQEKGEKKDKQKKQEKQGKKAETGKEGKQKENKEKKEKQGKEKEKDKEDDLCVICFSSQVNSVALFCGHMALCFECAQMEFKRSKKCVICRQEITNIMQVFKAN